MVISTFQFFTILNFVMLGQSWWIDAEPPWNRNYVREDLAINGEASDRACSICMDGHGRWDAEFLS